VVVVVVVAVVVVVLMLMLMLKLIMALHTRSRFSLLPSSHHVSLAQRQPVLSFGSIWS
jgi:type II secretory pathway component PulK